MNTLENKAIVYDDACPMCSLYTKGFVHWGILKPHNRLPFSGLEECTLPGRIDPIRSRHEIPLVDLQGGKTLYGVDALVFILKQRIPLIQYAITIRALYFLCRQMYAIVSYNRRIIVPRKEELSNTDWGPDFHLYYRIAFLVCCFLFSMLAALFWGMAIPTVFSSGSKEIAFINGIGWLVHTLLALILLKEKAIEYLGHTSTIMVLGGIFQIFILVTGTFLHHQRISIYLIGGILMSIVVFWQHSKRVHHVHISRLWSIFWGITIGMNFLQIPFFVIKNMLFLLSKSV